MSKCQHPDEIYLQVDPNRFQDDADKDANLFQLSFTCQKIIQVIINNEQKIPQYVFKTLPILVNYVCN